MEDRKDMCMPRLPGGVEMRSEDLNLPEGTLIIEYPFRWGGQFADKSFWCGIINQEVYDYHTKDHLINDAKENGWPWAVLRYHKDGRVSIVKSSPNLNNTTRSKK